MRFHPAEGRDGCLHSGGGGLLQNPGAGGRKGADRFPFLAEVVTTMRRYRLVESLLFLLAIATPVAVWGGSVSTNLDVTITGASVVPTESHIIIDNPPTDRSDTLEKAIADIDGDGILDVVWGYGTGRGGVGGLVWYTAPHSGDLTQAWAKHIIAPSGNFYEHAIAISIVGDGIPDIVASDTDQLVWFKNPRHTAGDPSSAPWPMIVINGSGGCHDMRVADLDGDGLLDVVCSGSTILGVSSFVAFQNSSGPWTIIGPANIGEGVALLDIGSGKGLIHIVGNDNVTGDLSWWENPRETGGNARTETWERRTIASPGAEGFSIETGILTQTGRMDVVVAQNENGPAGIQWYQAPTDRRNGIWTNRMIDSSYLAVHHISVHDMNADGFNDIVVAEQEQAGGAPQISPLHPGIPSRVTIFLNDGTGNFTADVIATTGGQELVIGDMNGRGDLGILSSNHGYYGAANPLEMWVNKTNMTLK